ncbi:DUF4157 domain-containing protein [Myxococcus stipitatus]|uniref:eCIS core domain-containing protein n=1 Tax=Myxococcus stipitatus TaxID=83455 RepID=UPI001F2C873E|nr:DUF4157 domain-containing protein [Myxococcus stipitatus]MCE9672850.1 DUF4157 domain-containing protein [Myxococcus stipitatus]
MQAKHVQASDSGQMTAPPIVHEALRSPGQPLDSATRAFMEPRFGYDFSQVRVHFGREAEQSARDVNAHAYTVGRDVVFGAGRFAPGTYDGRRLLAHELAHVVQQAPSGASGARASHGAPTRVYRQVGPGGGVSPRRIVYLDNDVVGAIVDGNKPVADALKNMLASGADVRMTLYNYRETTHGHDRVRAGARMLVVAKLGITIDNGGGLASRQATYVELSSGKPASVQPKDVPMIGAVRAAGPGAELWTLDGGPKENAKRFGIKLAPESSLKTGGAPLDVRVGLDNVGLQSYEIAADGTPVRRGQLLPGKVAPSAKPPSGPKGGPPSSAAPGSARTVNPGSGGGDAAKAIGPKPAGASATDIAVVEARPVLTERPGGSAVEIASPHALTNVAATQGAVEGAWGIILSHQLSSVRGAELKKALARFEELGPEIEAYRQKGIDVTVTVVAEVPKQPDVAARVTGVGNAGEVVYFKRMYISHLSLPPSAATSTQSTMYAAGERDPGRVDRSEMTLNQQVSAYWGDKYPVPGSGPREGFHFVEGKQTFPGYAPLTSRKPDLTTPDHLKGIAGTYKPELRKIFVGGMSGVFTLGARKLQVELGPQGVPTPKMTLGGKAYTFLDGGPRPPTMIMTGQFRMGEGLPPAAQWIWSSMEYHADKGIILEWAHVLDSALNTTWDALFLWRRL